MRIKDGSGQCHATGLIQITDATRKILRLTKEKGQKIVFILDAAIGRERDPATMVKRELVAGFVIGPADILKNDAINRQHRLINVNLL